MFIQIYKIIISLAFPVIKATYIKKRRETGKEHPVRFNERLAKYKHPRPEGKLFWFHGASVGEAVSMLPLIDRLLKDDENLSILVTTGTLTSAEIMEKRLPARAFHQFIPFDVPRYAKRFLKHFKPDAVLWFESELWPSLLSETHKRKIPLILVNGRISDKSFKTWKRFRFIVKEILSCFTLCLGQSEQDKNRLIVLGAPHAECFGNIKFAGMPLPVDENKASEMAQAIGDRKVFLISSTHANEEEQFAAHFSRLMDYIENILIIIVPRHPQRGTEIAGMLRNKGFETSLRSKNEPITEQTKIYVADTIGEMGIWYRLAPIVFVGGSLITHGGQNFMEPARDKCAVIVGPFMQNFVEMLARAQAAHAVWQIHSAADIIDEVISLFHDEQELLERQQNAYAWTVKEAQVLEGICQVLDKALKK